MLEKTFASNEVEIKIIWHIDDKQNIWFKGKYIAKILGYEDPSRVVRYHIIDPEDKFQGGGGR